jgi:hypothetical protein
MDRGRCVECGEVGEDLEMGSEAAVTVRMRNGETVVLSRTQTEPTIERLSEDNSDIGSVPIADPASSRARPSVVWTTPHDRGDRD